MHAIPLPTSENECFTEDILARLQNKTIPTEAGNEIGKTTWRVQCTYSWPDASAPTWSLAVWRESPVLTYNTLFPICKHPLFPTPFHTIIN